MINILSGVGAGIISGFGMGGGTILIFLLTSISGIDQHVAQACNLIFFIPTSIAAICINIKNRNVELKLALIISVCGIIGAIIGANIAVKTNVEILKKCFRAFLAVIALHEIYTLIKLYIKRKKEA